MKIKRSKKSQSCLDISGFRDFLKKEIKSSPDYKTLREFAQTCEKESGVDAQYIAMTLSTNQRPSFKVLEEIAKTMKVKFKRERVITENFYVDAKD